MLDSDKLSRESTDKLSRGSTIGMEDSAPRDVPPRTRRLTGGPTLPISLHAGFPRTCGDRPIGSDGASPSKSHPPLIYGDPPHRTALDRGSNHPALAGIDQCTGVTCMHH